MMKSKFFQLLLHQNSEKRLYMAKKKKEKRTQKSASLSSVLNFDNIFHNEKVNFTLGLLLAGAAVFLSLAFVSYLSTGAADQSMIEDPREGEILNQNHEFMNTCGSFGAWCSWYFIKRCFGLPAFLIPLFLLLLGVHLTKAYKVNLLKWFLSLMILMVWASVAMSMLLAPFFTETCYSPGGDHGLYVCHYLGNIVGTPGLTAILALTAIAFLTYLSAETIFVIRRILNPTKFLDKVKFNITNIDPKEETDDEPETEDDPEVFDDPATQTVEFMPDGKAVVIDEVYKTDTPEPSVIDRTQKKPMNTDDDVEFGVEEAKGDEAADKKTDL